MVALTGHASDVAPAAIARGLWRNFVLANAHAASGGGQNGQSRQAARGNSPAQDGQPAAQNPPATQNPPDGQNPPADQSPANPLFRTGIDFVRVDVIVSDRNGNAIADLKQSDFDVTEDGKPQSVETFKLVKLDGGSMPTADGPPRPIRNDDDEAAEAAKDDVRLFAVFLDDYHVKEGTSLSARAPISRFVETQLGPSDMIGVMHPLESIDQVRMTRNHSIISRAIQQFRGRKGNYTPQNDFEQNYANYPAETVEQIRNQVSLSAIKALIVHMGGLKEGRKALILVSEGYSNILPASLRDPIASMPGLGNRSAATRALALNDPNEARYAFFAGQDLEFFMQGVYEVASQNNVAIYPVDPRGLPVFEFDIDQPVNPTTDSPVPRQHAEHAQGAGGRDRWTRDPEPQRSRRRHEADHQGFERVLPDRLHDAGEVRREVPRHFGEGQASGRAGAVAQGILGADATGRGGRDDRRDEETDATDRGRRGAHHAGHVGSTEERAAGAHLDRHDARRERQDQGHVRLGADARSRRAIGSRRPAISRRACW